MYKDLKRTCLAIVLLSKFFYGAIFIAVVSCLICDFFRRRRDLLNNVTIKNCGKVEKFKKFKTI